MTWAAFVKRAYQAAREWGMQPGEFWRLSPWEWWAELDSRIIANRAIEERLEEAKSGKKGGSAFSRAEWDDARRRANERRAKQ